VSWEVPSDRAAQSVAEGLLMTDDTVDGCPAAVKASSSAEDTEECVTLPWRGMLHPNFLELRQREVRRILLPRTQVYRA
jgi:hypothetical protein